MLLELHKKSDRKKGCETLDVSSRRDEFIGRTISLAELTTEVPEAFSITLRIFIFSQSANKTVFGACSILSNFTLTALSANMDLEKSPLHLIL